MTTTRREDELADLKWIYEPLVLSHTQIVQSTIAYIAKGDLLSLHALYENLGFLETMVYAAEQAGFDLRQSYLNSITALGEVSSAYGDEDAPPTDDDVPVGYQKYLNTQNGGAFTPYYDPNDPLILPEGVYNDLDEFLEPQQQNVQPQNDNAQMDTGNDDDIFELPPIDRTLGQNVMSSHYVDDLAYQIMDIDPEREITYYRPNYDRSVRRRGRKRAFSEIEEDERPDLLKAVQRQLYMSTTHSSMARNQLSALMIVKNSAYEKTIERVSDLGYSLLEFAETVKVKERILFIPKPNTQAVTQYREMVFQASHLDARHISSDTSAGPSIMASIMSDSAPKDHSSSPKKKKKSRFDSSPKSDQLCEKKPSSEKQLRSPILTRSREIYALDPEFRKAIEAADDSDTLSLDAQPID